MDSSGGLQLDAFSNSHQFPISQDAQSDIGDGSSSSLSEIENAADNDLEALDSDSGDDDDNTDEREQEGEEEEEEDEVRDEDEDELEDEQEQSSIGGREPGSDFNDSEAETERLEDSPHAARRHRDVLLNSQAISRTFERSPSKLFQSHNIQQDTEDFSEEEDDDDDDADHDEEEGRVEIDNQVDHDSGTNLVHTYARPNRHSSSIMRGAEFDELPVTDALRDSSFSKKRKRSLLPERHSSYPEDDEPATKRPAREVDDFAIDDTGSGHEDNAASNSFSAQASETSSVADDGDLPKNKEATDILLLQQVASKESPDSNMALISDGNSHRRSRSHKSLGVEDPAITLETEQMDVDTIDDTKASTVEDLEEDIEEDEAEIALKNEAEQKRRKSLAALTEIQRSYDKLRTILYTERMALLEQEEVLLKTKPPTHPQYIEMTKCIDARHDNKLDIEKKLMKFKQGAIQRTATATRAQILSQFHQEVRDIRERKLEKCGNAWYDIQSDRRSFGAQPEKYAFPFPTKKSTQIMHHNQYTKEISLLSSIAKNVGFPAAPSMNGATQEELESDLEKMGQNFRRKQVPYRSHHTMPNLAALRAATSESSLKPAEERFIEQNAWANPQHPSNAHLIQRQSNAQQPDTRSAPYLGTGGMRRQPHHHVQQQPHRHHHHHHHTHQTQHHHQMSTTPAMALFGNTHSASGPSSDRPAHASSYEHVQHLKSRVPLAVNSMEQRQATQTPEATRQKLAAAVPAHARKPLPVAPIHSNVEISTIKRE